MPELPEVETIAGDLSVELAGRRVLSATVTRSDVLRGTTARQFRSRLAGVDIIRVWRRAKSAVMKLSSGDHLVVTPRFTGTIQVLRPDSSSRDPYEVARLALDDGRELTCRDVRRLGTVALMSAAGFQDYDARLGVEPLDPEFSIQRLSAFLRHTSQATKKALMDQRRIAGIGNIYANEALWMAGIDPSRAGKSLSESDVAKLHDDVVMLLRAAVRARGTTFRDYRDAYGARGGYAAELKAYGRQGMPCPRCGTRIALTHAIDARATYFCFRCQH